jgi:Golgi phosphoprotein 3 (GPP34)
MTIPARDPRAPRPQLAGTGRLADDLYLLAHHERTGRLVLSPRAAGLGLAGGLLGELVLADAVGICGGEVVTGAGLAEDALAESVLGQVAGEGMVRPVGEWLAFLARTAPGGVAGRLAAAGYLAAVPPRPWRAPRWVPVSADCAFAPVTRVKAALDETRPADAQAVALAGLASACGLGARLAGWLPPGSRPRMDAAAGRLDAGLREVITQTHAAVGAALLAHRI